MPSPKIYDSATIGAPWLRKNWREPDPKADAARCAAATEVRAARTKVIRYTYKPGPRTVAGVLHADQIRGTIVFRWVVRKFPSKKVPDSDPRIFHKDGVRYLKKGRYWLIVKSTSKKLWEAPIYTNNDTGLQNTNPKEWKEYFSLRPNTVSADSFKNQSPNNKVFSIDWMKEDDNHMHGRKMRRSMVVHFTEVKVRSINIEDVQIVGALAEAKIEAACDKAAPHIKT